MGAPDEHVTYWRTFRTVAGVLGTSATPLRHWAIVVRFYSALHLTEAYMRTKAERFWASTRHEDRRRNIRDSPELGRRFAAAYDTLKSVSERLRYEPPDSITDRDHTETEKALEQVESFLRSKLSSQGIDSTP